MWRFTDGFYGGPEEDQIPVLVMHSEDDQIVPYVRRAEVGKAAEEWDADYL